MKRILSIIVVLIMAIQSIPVIAMEKSEEDIYDEIINENNIKCISDVSNSKSIDKDLKVLPNKITNVVVLIRFKGESEFMNLDKSNGIEKTYNELINSESTSLKAYINNLTFGKSDLQTEFYPKSQDGTQYISLEAPNTKEYYLSKGMGSADEEEFIKWAIESIKGEVQLTGEQLDPNNDGVIDNVTLITNGVVIENNNMLWPHKSTFRGNVDIEGKKVHTYNILNSGSNMNNVFNKKILRVIVHEFLHSYNYPDLYRYSGIGNPVGKWDIMAANAGEPQLPLVYSRNIYGQASIKIEEINTDGSYTLKSSTIANENDVMAYKIKSPLAPNEYFMVEFRKAQGKWDASLPDSGLIVYRINNNVNYNSGNTKGSPDHIYIFRPELTSIELADGNIDLAYLSKEAGRTNIGTSNLSDGISKNTIHFQNGSNSGIEIYDVGSSAGDSITFKVRFPQTNGSGTKEDPYLIDDKEGLLRINNNLNKHFKITKDIDLKGINWNPIGNDSEFLGSLNGNGFKISNMTININDSNAYVGLFSSIGVNGIVENLTLDNINVNTTGGAGAVAGMNQGIIRNVSASGNILADSHLGAGGIVNNTTGNTAIIEGCISNVNIKSKSVGNQYSKPMVGGIASQNYGGLVKENYATGELEATEGSLVGGVFGRNISPLAGSDNNFWDVNTTKQNKGTDLSGVTGESESGLIGIKIPVSIEVPARTSKSVGVEYFPGNSTLVKRYETSDSTIATIENDMIYAKNKNGQVTGKHIVKLGSKEIVNEFKINVTGGGSNSPVINGVKDITIKVGEVDKFDLMNGITVTDDLDNNLQIKIVGTLGKPAAGTNGTYKIEYSVEDSDGNISKVTRNITVTNGVPEITGVTDITIKEGEYVDIKLGVTAKDNEDGDLTTKIIYPNINTANLKVGTHKIKYVTTDSDGNNKEVLRNIIVIKNQSQPPVINGVKDITIKVGEVDKFDLMNGITIIDDVDNNLQIKVAGTLGKPSAGTNGTYKIEYSVEDSDGNISKVTRNITVTNGVPEITGLTDIIVKESRNVDLKLGVTARDNEDEDLTTKIIYPNINTTNLKVGTHKVKYLVTDSDGNNKEALRNVIVTPSEVKVTSIIGKDRYDTAVKASATQFLSADTIVIVNGEAMADGLTATPLATYLKAPVLLTKANVLPKVTIDEIKRLKPKNAIIAGGSGVVKPEIETALKGLGINNVTRLGGINRYETSLQIAKYIDSNCYDVDKIVIANGYGEADALSISPVAGRDKMPIILVEKNLIQKKADEWLVKEKIEDAYIIGGDTVVSNKVMNRVNEITTKNISANRLGGKNRFATNAQVIDRFYSNELDRVYITKGLELIDALSIGSIAGITNRPVVLSNITLTTEQINIFNKRCGNRVIQVGGGVSSKSIYELRELLLLIK